MHAKLFLLVEVKAQWTEVAVRYIRADNTVVGEIILHRFEFQCAGIWISIILPFIYVYTINICSQFRFAQNSTVPVLPEHNSFLSSGMSVVGLKALLHTKCVKIISLQ